jgi:hypothetical protein
MPQDRISLHTARALAEIHLARAAPCPAASKAHLELSALHLDAVRDLTARKRFAKLSDSG